MPKSNIITLITDFGLDDGFAGVMKGVILGINPGVNLIDISHNISKHNISAAAFLLNNSYKFFPKNSIHLVIVDPGVGSFRKAIIVQTNKYYFIAPDNQVLKYILNLEKEYKVFEIQNDQFFLQKPSNTFHGRDIFAPVAAHLSTGIESNEIGSEIFNFKKGEILKPVIEKSTITGQIMYIDIFGNLITNIDNSLIKNQKIDIILGKYRITSLSNSYSNGIESFPIALIGSAGYLEISINQKSAHQILKLDEGDEITIKLIENG